LKNTLHLIVLSFLMLAPVSGIMPEVCAQGWQWGRASVQGVDSWAVATDAAGNVYGGGITIGSDDSVNFGGGVTVYPTSVGGYTSIWVKYSNSGTPLWAGCTVGESWLNNIAVDPGGNLILFGSFDADSIKIGSFKLTNAYGTAGGTQYYIAKINPSGTVLWAINDGNTYASYTSESFLSAYILSDGGVTTDAAGNIYITASFNKPSMTIGSTTLTNGGTSAGSYDIFVAKYSPAGVPLWATSLPGTLNDYAFGIAVASTGDVYVSGDFYSPSITVGSGTLTNPYTTTPLAFIAKFSSAGVPLWGQSAGGSAGAFGVGLAKDNYGNVYMTGGFANPSISFGSTTVTKTYPATGGLALFLVQYSPSDVVTWSKTIGSASEPLWGYSIAMASCGQVWVSGNYTEDANIDDSILAIVPGHDPVFIAGYNLAGGVVGYAGLGSGGDDQNGIACDGNGNVFICSDIFDGTTIDAGADTITATSGGEIFYLAKYTNTVTHPDTISIVKDTIPCNADSITLHGLPGYANYYWSNGSSDSTLTVTVAGTYFVQNVTCGDTTIVDTFHVSFLPFDTSYTHADSAICVAIASVTLTAPAGYTSYIWNTLSTAASIVVTDSGRYIVDATSPSTCSVLVDTFHYIKLPYDTTFLHAGQSACASVGTQVVNAPPGYLSYAWNTGSIASFITVSANGSYMVLGANGCAVVSDTFNVVFMPVPVVNLGTDTVFCPYGSLTLTSTQPHGSGYMWSTGSSDSAVTLSLPGTYWLMVTDTNLCRTSDTITIYMDPIHASFTTSPNPQCQRQQVAFTDASVATTPSYQWSFGDGNTAAGLNPTHTYLNTGTYNAYEVVTDYLPCHDTAYQTVFVDSQSQISLNITDSVLCQGTYVTFNGIYSSIGNTGIAWSMGNGDSIKDKNPISFAYEVPGTYTVTATAQYRICHDTSVSRTLTIIQSPSVNLGRDTTICKGSDAFYLSDNINVGNRNATWIWNTGQTTPGISITAPGDYWVTVNIGGCTATSSIKVGNDCYMNIPNVFTPNNDGLNDYFFPQQLLASGLTSFKMDIYNRWGELIFETTSLDGRGWDGKFNNTDQPEGVYVYLIDATFKDGQKEHHQGNVTLLR